MLAVSLGTSVYLSSSSSSKVGLDVSFCSKKKKRLDVSFFLHTLIGHAMNVRAANGRFVDDT